MNTEEELTEVPVESLISESKNEEKPEINLDLSEDVPIESNNEGYMNSLMNFFNVIKIILLRLVAIVNSHFFTLMDEVKDLYNVSKEKMN